MDMTDYARIERAIHFLESSVQQQPSLSDVAASVNLSEFHFQRMFTRWAGISPKRFLQFQTTQHAKELLAASRKRVCLREPDYRASTATGAVYRQLG